MAKSTMAVGSTPGFVDWWIISSNWKVLDPGAAHTAEGHKIHEIYYCITEIFPLTIKNQRTVFKYCVNKFKPKQPEMSGLKFSYLMDKLCSYKCWMLWVYFIFLTCSHLYKKTLILEL